MEVEKLLQILDNPAKARSWFSERGLHNGERAQANLVQLAKVGLPMDLLSVICEQLSEQLPLLSDPDRALNNLERFISSSRSPLSLGSLFERDPDALTSLLQIFSTSQYLSDWLVRDPEAFDLLRLTEGQPVAREVLVEEIWSEVAPLSDETTVMNVMRRYKHRETLRIAYGDLIRQQRIDTVTHQISYLAEALCEVAVRFAHQTLEKKWGAPQRADGQRCRFVVLAMGKLGGQELNYSSDIDLVFLSDGPGQTDGDRSTSNDEYFQRLAKLIVKLLSESTDYGTAYRVDLRLRPDGKQGPAVVGFAGALRYYDVKGRTWERQAYVKARAIAGDIDLGQQFLGELESWVYRRYLSRADITGIKALKRRIEHRTVREGNDARNVKTGNGGIRDIEFVIQFLQLLNGGDIPELRTENTLEAISRLTAAECLNTQERLILEENYAFLRKIEHRLQILFDLQTHTLPDDEDELRRVAIRMGFQETPEQSALEAFQQEYQQKTTLNRQILDHLLHDAFPDDKEDCPEVDLVLDPQPNEAWIQQVLGKYKFKEVGDAYNHLTALAQEKIPFLSTRRCRHFLASIAVNLLEAISQTPDPDRTLVDLCKVSDSIGGKGVLWELFSFNPPSLQLCVRLCASSSYLTGILTSHPGMIDELMDSLVLDKLPSLESLDRSLAELCRAAEDIDPILASFKHSNHLRVGVRDILGKEDIRNTHHVLSDVAEVCLKQIADREYRELVERYGTPTIAEGDRAGEVCSMVILAMGKLGGQEPNYHSDLDVVFFYEADGTTRVKERDRRASSTTNQHFFGQLAQKIVKAVNRMGPYGRLYELDARLRPTGKSGALAINIREFDRYFSSGQGQLWERQALCKARPIYGPKLVADGVMEAVYRAITVAPWSPEDAESIRSMRMRLEETASKLNLKRGPGGTVDIEFAVQMLQLQYAAQHREVLQPGTIDAIEALRNLGLDSSWCDQLAHGYRFLRSIEARLRLMNTTARHDLASEDSELKRLAFLLGYGRSDDLVAECKEVTDANRKLFEEIFDSAVAATR